jgi:hypothetical protein
MLIYLSIKFLTTASVESDMKWDQAKPRGFLLNW